LFDDTKTIEEFFYETKVYYKKEWIKEKFFDRFFPNSQVPVDRYIKDFLEHDPYGVYNAISELKEFLNQPNLGTRDINEKKDTIVNNLEEAFLDVCKPVFTDEIKKFDLFTALREEAGKQNIRAEKAEEYIISKVSELFRQSSPFFAINTRLSASLPQYQNTQQVAGVIAIGSQLAKDSIWTEIKTRNIIPRTMDDGTASGLNTQDNSSITVLSALGGSPIFMFADIDELKQAYETPTRQQDETLHLDCRFKGLLPDIFPEDDEISFWFVLAEYFGNRDPDRDVNPNTFIRESNYIYTFFTPIGKYSAKTRNSAYNRWLTDSKKPKNADANVYFPIASVAEKKFNAMSALQQKSILDDCNRFLMEKCQQLTGTGPVHSYRENLTKFIQYLLRLGITLTQDGS
jgi:hypothetical protein